MAKKCAMCGKTPVVGRQHSHANNVSARRFEPNLQTVRALVNGGITVFSPDGATEHVAVADLFTTNLCFGGEDMCDVLITTADNLEQPELGGTLLRARSEIPGQPVYAALI